MALHGDVAAEPAGSSRPVRLSLQVNQAHDRWDPTARVVRHIMMPIVTYRNLWQMRHHPSSKPLEPAINRHAPPISHLHFSLSQGIRGHTLARAQAPKPQDVVIEHELFALTGIGGLAGKRRTHHSGNRR